MNADASEGAPSDFDAALTEAIISYCQLTPDQIDRVKEARLDGKLGFGEAALQLFLITPKDLVIATEWAEEVVSRKDSRLIETAIRRARGQRTALIPRTKTVKPGPRLKLAHDPHSSRSEQIRSLRTELLLRMPENRNRARIFALLSPCAGEGRSQLAAEIAIAFSHLGQATLLMDGDLRRPGQHLLFDADNSCGLAQALTTGEIPPLFKVEGMPRLSILTAGNPVSNPLELLSDGSFGRFLGRWNREYDFIVIDSPPVSEFADGLAIASVAEQVVVLSRANVTRQRHMREMLRRLATTNSRILGAVINKF